MRELLRAVMTHKPIITLVETDMKHGAMGYEDMCKQLRLAVSKYEKWGLLGEMQQWQQEGGVGAIPTAEDLRSALFKDELLEWNRIKVQSPPLPAQ